MSVPKKVWLVKIVVVAILSFCVDFNGTHILASDANNALQQELNQDADSLKLMSKSKDIAGFNVLATHLQTKWLAKDVSRYVQITSSICEDLSNYNFGLKNINAVKQLDQKFAAAALVNAKQIPIGVQAFFTIQVAQPDPSANDIVWPTSRRAYAEQILSIWQTLQEQANHPIGNEPPRPPVPWNYVDPKKYPNGVILVMGSRIDPAYITDASVRSSYQAALKNYDAYFEVVQKKQDAINSLRWYKLVAPTNLASMYASGLDGTEELTLLLKKYNIPDQEQSGIFKLLISDVPVSPVT